MFLGHLRRFGGVPFPKLWLIDGSEIGGGDVLGSSYRSQRLWCDFLRVGFVFFEGGILESNEVSITVTAIDEPHTDLVCRR